EGEPVGTVGPSGVPELDVPYVYLGIRRAGDEQGYLDPLLFLPASSPGAVEPPADGGEAAPPEPAPVPAAAPPAALAQSAPADAGPAPPARPRAPVHPTPHVRGRSRALPAVPRDRGRARRTRTPLATRAVPVQTRSPVETRSRADLPRGSSV